jgi:antitoxin component of MazEF toxin-antitoxin module
LPITRKIIRVGTTSRGICLPKSWLDFIEKKTGKQVQEVAIEVNENLLISPILEASV